jgi:hypothetical protein
MSPKEAIVSLSQNLGVNPDILWSVLTKQVVSNGLMDLIVVILISVGIYYFFPHIVKAYVYVFNRTDGGREDGWNIILIFMVFAGGTLIITDIVCFVDGFQMLFNPGYYAIELITDML